MKSQYSRLALMAASSFVAMFVLMYAMVDSLSNVYLNVNQLYMAALMTSPMVALELVSMREMYPDRRKNAVIGVASLVSLLVFWMLIRQQVGVGDRQFLRSMIPHHAGAILMCEEAPIRDAAVETLCRSILASQKAEIEQMKAMLR